MGDHEGEVEVFVFPTSKRVPGFRAGRCVHCGEAVLEFVYFDDVRICLNMVSNETYGILRAHAV